MVFLDVFVFLRIEISSSDEAETDCVTSPRNGRWNGAYMHILRGPRCAKESDKQETICGLSLIEHAQDKIEVIKCGISPRNTQVQGLVCNRIMGRKQYRNRVDYILSPDFLPCRSKGVLCVLRRKDERGNLTTRCLQIWFCRYNCTLWGGMPFGGVAWGNSCHPCPP